MNCKKCESELSEGSLFCNKCGSKTDNNINAQNNLQKDKMQSTNKQATRNNSGCLFWGIITVIIIGIFVGVSTNFGNSSNIKVEAWTVAQDAVKSGLKSPSSASFPWDYDKYVTDNGNSTYSVSAYVDSENSFGAKIRSNFSVTIIKEGSNYSYKDLWIQGN